MRQQPIAGCRLPGAAERAASVPGLAGRKMPYSTGPNLQRYKPPPSSLSASSLSTQLASSSISSAISSATCAATALARRAAAERLPPSRLASSGRSCRAPAAPAARLASPRRVAPLPPPTPRKARFQTHQGQVGHVAPRADVQRGENPLRRREQRPNQSPFLSRGPGAAHVAVCVWVCDALVINRFQYFSVL